MDEIKQALTNQLILEQQWTDFTASGKLLAKNKQNLIWSRSLS